MEILGLIDEDLINYKKCSMYIIFPKCSFKCGKENCQNYKLESASIINITPEKICRRYVDNSLSEAVVLGGLEPFDSPFDLLDFINCLRYKYKNDDDIVIYTGYKEREIQSFIEQLKQYKNIIVKFGRFRPYLNSCYDPVLKVNLASNNQYAKKIS